MEILKALHHSSVATGWGSALVEAYIRLVFRTSKVLRDPTDIDAKLFAQHPQIFAMWHGQFMMVPMIKPETRADIAIIAARHKDADMLAKTLQRFGMCVIRGAGDAGRRPRSRGGSAALRGALHALRNGATFAMTAHVPPGPAPRAGDTQFVGSTKPGRSAVRSTWRSPRRCRWRRRSTSSGRKLLANRDARPRATSTGALWNPLSPACRSK